MHVVPVGRAHRVAGKKVSPHRALRYSRIIGGGENGWLKTISRCLRAVISRQALIFVVSTSTSLFSSPLYICMYYTAKHDPSGGRVACPSIHRRR